MPQSFVLHLGLHKTATTALQDFLMGQSKALLAAGVRYIPLGRMRSDVTPLLTSLEDGKRFRLASFLEAINKPCVLLSDENIIGTPGDIMEGSLYPYARNRVESFCDEQQGRSITLVLTLRDPHAFFASLYSEYLRHNAFVSFSEYFAGFNIEDFSFLEIFGWLAELPPHISVRVIPFEAAHGGGVENIARAIVEAACGQDHQVDFAAFPKVKSRSSFTVEELEIAADIAKTADPRTAQHFLNMLDGRSQRFGTTRFEPLSAELARELSSRYEADLAAFAARPVHAEVIRQEGPGS
jgi:hypothetical protein